VFRKGQATIPKELRERFGIETPGKVLVREEEGKIVVEPLLRSKRCRASTLAATRRATSANTCTR